MAVSMLIEVEVKDLKVKILPLSYCLICGLILMPLHTFPLYF